MRYQSGVGFINRVFYDIRDLDEYIDKCKLEHGEAAGKEGRNRGHRTAPSTGNLPPFEEASSASECYAVDMGEESHIEEEFFRLARLQSVSAIICR